MPNPLRVLLLDDDAHERALAATLLGAPHTGLTVVEIAGAVAFAEELAQNRFDAVVVDPKLRWAEAISVIEAVKRSGRSRAAVLLAPDGDETVLAAYKHGLDDHVAKTAKGWVTLAQIVRDAVARASATTSESDARLQRLFDKLGRATFTCASDGRLLEANGAFAELLGFASVRDALRTNAFTLLLPDDTRAQSVDRLHNERFLQLDANVAADGGRTIKLALAMSLHRTTGGAATITGLLEKRAEPESVAPRALATAHDLKEPLRTLARSAEALRARLGAKLDRESAEDLQFIHDAARRMREQLGVAFGEPPRAVEPPSDDADANEAFERARANLRASIEATEGAVTVDPLPRVRASGDELVQLFQNLVGNALKYRGDANPKVHVAARREGTFIRFTVTDNGVGVAPADRERIFQLFQRVERTSHVPGTGIGLATCRRIVEARGGRIWVEPALPQGAHFVFTLPAASDRAPLASVPSTRAKSA